MTIRPSLHKLLTIVPALLLLATATAPSTTWAQEENDGGGVVERYEEWVLNCSNTNDGQEICQIRQTRQTQGENPLLMSLSLIKFGGDYRLVSVVPLGALLQFRPAMGIEDTEINVPGAYVRCMNGGCQVAFAAETATLDALGAGEWARVAVQQPNNQPLAFRFSLAGFSAARAALEARP
ncbi:MAG: invasion associated locus B family protein [Alphaproteobacteria bacterium]